MAKLGYMRVSKSDGSQVLDLQRDALIEVGVKEKDLYEDKCSGAKDDRPGLNACLKALRQGDVLVIWRLDRLGRNLKHLLETVDILDKQGVGFKVITGASIDTTSSQGKLSFVIFAAIAEFERAMIKERTIAGLKAARARGRKGGRKPVLTPSKLRRAQAAMQHRDTSVYALCKELGISKQTLYNHVTATGDLTDRGRAILGVTGNAASTVACQGEGRLS